MSEDKLNDRLTQAMTGTPQTRPDERRQYLGSLRERVALAVTNAELEQATTLPATKTALAAYRGQAGYKLLLNGKNAVEQNAPYMQAAKALDLPFTLVADDSATTTPDAFALLLVNAEALNRDDIRLPRPNQAKAAKKRGWLDDLFH